MIWNVCFIASILVLCITFLQAFIFNKSRSLNSYYLVFIGVFVAVFISLIPVYSIMLLDDTGYLLKLIVFDFLQTIRIFTINIEADIIIESITSNSTNINEIYSIYMTILFFVSPLLTFSFLVSIINNIYAEVSYFLNYNKALCVFSRLNEKSLLLAQNIKRNHNDYQIIFTNVNKTNDTTNDYLLAAKEMNSIIICKSIINIDFFMHNKKSLIDFYMIDDNENNNLVYSLKLIEKYNTRKNTNIYVFSKEVEGELLLSNVPKGEIKVRRINEVRSSVYNFLYNEGDSLFKSSYLNENGDREINVVIAGLGNYGIELLRGLTWYSQMDGYSIRIDAFDKDESVKEVFEASYPDLISKKYNGTNNLGDSKYTINIHSGIDVRTKKFIDIIQSIPNITFAFVCLGSDNDNIKNAVNLRIQCARLGYSPKIKTIIYDNEEKEILAKISNYKGQSYDIESFGDINTIYSENVLLCNELENLALARHLKWGKEEDFWQYEYNYRSSMASAIHMKARIACNIPGSNKKESELTLEEREIIENLEHRRWNAYMRSEGYVYSGSTNKNSRNDLAKMHNDLVSFETLTEEEKRKDLIV